MQRSSVNSGFRPKDDYLPPEDIYFYEVLGMPLNEKDRKEIRALISTATAATKPDLPSSTLPPAPPEPREPWLKRNGYWITPLIGLSALLIAVLALIIGPGIMRKIFTLAVNDAIDGRLEKPKEDIRLLQIGVAKIQTRLDLIEKASLKPQDFKRTLPELAASLKTAYELNVPTSPEIKEALQQNLQETKNDSAEYWQAVSQFVAYRSEQQAPPEVRKMLDLEKVSPLIYCYNSIPFPERIKEGQAFPFVWSGCIVSLEDNPTGTNMFTSMLETVKKNASGPGRAFLFQNCIVRYHGGQLSPTMTEMLRLSFFRNCVFDFSVPKLPSVLGQRILTALLAISPSGDVQISGS